MTKNMLSGFSLDSGAKTVQVYYRDLSSVTQYQSTGMICKATSVPLTQHNAKLMEQAG